eukprot:scaffold144299_cov148-Phaeocystis_antarctica.AAC.2
MHRARPREVHPLCAPQFSSAAGEKQAQNKPRRVKHAQNLQALSLSTKPVPPESLRSMAPFILSAPLTACGLRRRWFAPV